MEIQIERNKKSGISGRPVLLTVDFIVKQEMWNKLKTGLRCINIL
jgi:hypothetical protein